MRCIIDGDACAGISIIQKIVSKYNIESILYCDINHHIKNDYIIVKIVDSGFQSVDMYVVNETSKDDVVITQDYGVAALCLGKGAYVIDPKGYIYTNNNIDRLLNERHISQKNRKKKGVRVKGPSKRNVEDDSRLETNLEKIILNILKRN